MSPRTDYFTRWAFLILGVVGVVGFVTVLVWSFLISPAPVTFSLTR